MEALAGPVEDLSTLQGMLRQAAELEHQLCCQYLYAAFSLKRAGDEGVSAAQGVMLEQWQRQILRVAVQEMYHLLLANNLLTAVGAEPHLRRPNFPQPRSAYSEMNLPSQLSPFDLATVSRFVCWEKPDATGWWSDFCRQLAETEQRRWATLLAESAAVAAPPCYASIAQLYGEIDAALRHNPGWIDPARGPFQVTSVMVPFSPKVEPITTCALASRYIEIIVSEGEGTPDWQSKSHFAYFHQIRSEMENAPGFVPAWPAVDNPFYGDGQAPPGANPITASGARALGLLAAQAYHLMLRTLSRLFVYRGESPEQRQRLGDAAGALMPLVVRPLGIALTRTPAGPAYAGRFAGPSFELDEGSLVASGDRDDVWGALRAEARGLATRCHVLSLDTSVDLPDEVRQETARAASTLQTLVPLFQPSEQ